MKRALSVATVAILVLLLTPISAMAANGTITGTVRTPGGAGIANACIDVHKAGDSLSRTVHVAQNNGSFSISVAPGNYVLRFSDCNGGEYAQEWYSNKLSFEEADVVTVGDGETEQLGNITLADAAQIAGKVTTTGDSPLAGMCVTAQDPDRPTIRSTAKTTSNGTFTVAGLPAGTYVLSSRDCVNNPAMWATSWYSGTTTVARGADAATRVTATSGQVTNLATALFMPRGASLSGTIVNANNQPVAGVCILAIDLDSNSTAGTTTSSSGTWSIHGLLPGDWIVKVSDCRPGVAERNRLATIFLGEGVSNPHPAVAENNPFELSTGANTAGTDTMSAGGALSGALRIADDTDALRTPNSSGVAIPNACVGITAPNSLEILRAVRTSASGSFTIGGLDPALGYSVVAYNCGNGSKFGLEWHSDSLLAFESDGVVVTAGSTVSIGNLEVGELVRRAAGAHRRLTANALALGGWTSSQHVVIASEAVYADALAGAPFAALVDAPLLLVDGDGLTSDVADTIDALGAQFAWILGGPVTITRDMEAQLGQQTGVERVERIAGSNRFETARAIASRMAPSVDTSRAYVVEGDHALDTRGWPDAMSVAGLAAFEQVPLLLVTADVYPTATKQALDELNVAHVDIVGGPNAVSDAVKNAIDGDVGTVNRIFGADRYGTSMAVVDTALARGAWSRTVWMASGLKFPDSLVGGAAVAQDGGILMLVNGLDSVDSPATEAKLAELSDAIDRVILLGGEATITQTTANRIVGLVD